MDRAAADRFLPAARAALAAFPIEAGELTPVWAGENITFRAQDSAGGAHVLRLHRPGYHSLAALEAERAWTGALTAAGIAVPVGLRARDGAWYVPVATPDPGGTRFAGVTRWTEGEVLEAVLAREGTAGAPGHFHALGAIIATLHTQAAAWTPPAGFVRHALDRDGFMGEAPFWGRFWDSAALTGPERSMVLAARRRIAGILDHLGQDPAIFGLIHADLHPGNVLVGQGRVTVIDFDDAGFGWHAYDLAVALFYPRAEPDFPAIQDALLAGYRTVRPLDPRTEAMIPLFLLIRGLALIGWLHQRPEVEASGPFAIMLPLILAECERLAAASVCP